MKGRWSAALLLLTSLASSETASAPLQIVIFPSERIPHSLWDRELVWMHNIGVEAIIAPQATAELKERAADARLAIVSEPPNAVRTSGLSPHALIESRIAMLEHRPVVWTDVESESAPVFRVGAVSFGGDESPTLAALHREGAAVRYWSDVLGARQSITSREATAGSVGPGITFYTRQASLLSIVNDSPKEKHGNGRAFIARLNTELQIPNLTIDAGDALLLPIDVALTDSHLCPTCSGMSNSERLIYASAELTGIEYENGILSFEFYAPHAGSAVLQLEREPNGPMLASGKPVAYDWDPENKRARLPIPEGKGKYKRVRIAITMTAPDEVASFRDVKTLVLGQKNRIVTEYSSDALKQRSRLMAPEGWTVTPEQNGGDGLAYWIDVPRDRLHGDHALLTIEADGVGISHVRPEVVKPVSLRVPEAEPLTFGDAADLVTDAPVVPVESTNGRTLSVVVRNYAPEIKTFTVELNCDGLEFSPAKTDLVVGASASRELSVHVFPLTPRPGLLAAQVRMTGAAELAQPILFVLTPHNQVAQYQADLTGTGTPYSVWENARLRAVFSQADGGRWISFLWKPSGKSLLPPEGVEIGSGAVLAMDGDALRIEGGSNLPNGGKSGNVTWTAEKQHAAVTYRVSEVVNR